jgi:uncharacterized protein YggE
MHRPLTIAAFLAWLALPLVAQAPRPPAGGPPLDAVPTLIVSGSGQARVAPDEAHVRLGVLAQAPTARAVQDQVSRTANAVLDAIHKVGIPAEDIQTSGLSLSPLYSQIRQGNDNQPPRITGYQANNTVTVRVGDLAKTGPVIDAGLGAGANTLEGVDFGLRNDEAARAQALADAARTARAKAETLAKTGPVIDAGLGAGANTLEGVDFGLRNDEAARAQALADAARTARAKAETLAKALGVRLGELLEVAEGGVSISPPPSPRFGMARMEAVSMAPTPVSAGQVGVEASVTLRYRISQ